MNTTQPPDPKGLAQTQFAFAAHIRDPQANPRPTDVEERRMAIYRDLFYNNVEGFLADNFPVLRKLTPDRRWHAMARDFLARHRCRTPLFPEFGQEFLAYLEGVRGILPDDPPFLLELAHYEWVEVAVAMGDADRDAPAADPNGDPFQEVPVISPLAWNLTYRFPVHRIGPEFQPGHPGEQPTHLVVYRDRRDQVQFLEINPVTQRLLQLLKENPDWTGLMATKRIAVELQHPQPHLVMDGGRQIIEGLRQRNVIIGTRPASGGR
jgi:hypothetical protein